MRRPRTLAALALGLLSLVLVPSASAIDPFPTTGVTTLENQYFILHYSRDDVDTTCGNFITQEKAGDILGMLERARKFYVDDQKLGAAYPNPVPGAGAKVNVSIDDFEHGCVPFGAIPPATPIPWLRWDALVAPNGVPNADDIHINAAKDGAVSYPVIAHEVFHLVEDAIVSPADPWLQEGTAEWAATRANADAGGTELNPDRTLDCVGSECGDSEYDKNGYPGWMLFEYLAERYGDSKVRDVWTQAVSTPVGTTALANVLPVSLASFFNDYTTARLTGNFTFAALAGQLPNPYANVTVGSASGALPTSNVAVNHLAVRYLTLSHGTDTVSPCFAATLTINVAIPSGVTSTPYYYANTKGASAQALTVSGSTASITIPDWNTCGASPNAYLSLPNDTLGADGREFVVSGSVNVDLNKPASPSDPPPGATVIGSVVPAPTSDPAPTLRVYAPELIRVSAKTRLLRFAVFSSGDGKLNATLGSTSLGSAALRGGNNDVRFVLPSALFKSRRTTAASLLQLTSVSPSGTKGATVTRRVLLQAPKKPKPKKRR